MRYQVPQFIEVEDKIFGPFTFRQFVYMAGGAGFAFFLYRMLPFYVSVPIIIPVVTLSAALAFYRVNNRPFIDIMESAFKYLTTAKLYIWKKVDKKAEDVKPEDQTSIVNSLYVPKLSDSKLKDLAWSLDINETVYSKDTGKLQAGKTAVQNAWKNK